MWNIWILVWNMDGCLVGRLLRVFLFQRLYVCFHLPAPRYLIFAFCRGGYGIIRVLLYKFLDEMALP